VQAEAAVLVLVVAQVAHHLLLRLRAQHGVQGARSVQGDDQAGHEEHRAAVVAWPVAVVLLQALVETDGALEVI
jgi:trimethylamine:corrinoid methyltransferase-like protein